MGSPLPTGLEASPACPLSPPDLGPGLDDPRIAAALARLRLDPEAPALVVFGSRARGEASPCSDLDLLLIVAAAHWAGSRWHVLGHIHREGRPLHAA
jgi:hypothetical protein